MSRYLVFAAVMLSTSFAVGCGEELGACNDPNEARDTVLVGDTLQYAGQAIMNKSCAGCHGSNSKGEVRKGAPAGLDFDLAPIPEEDAKGKKSDDDDIVKLSRAQLEGLWERQNIVYDNRDSIWQQVRDGLMPPEGLSVYFDLSGIFSSDDEPCTKGKELENLAEQKQVLRNWLACGAPIVESSGSVVQEPETPGVVGYQYPMCSGGDVRLVEGEVSLEALLQQQLGLCFLCHQPGPGVVDLSTAAAFKAALVDKTGVVCNGKPWIKKGDASKSFLIDMLSKENPGCKMSRMPTFPPHLTKAQIAQVAEWIDNGAPYSASGKEPTDGEPSDGEPTDGEPADGEPSDGEPSDGEPSDGEPTDPEPTQDAGRPAADAGARDAGRDAGPDAGADAGRDAGRDARR